MKRFSQSREGTLKGLLLMALVANLTWEPLTNHFSEIDLASTQAARLDCTGKDKADARCKPLSSNERSQIVQAAERLRAEEAAKGNKAPKRETEAQATESCNDCVETDKALAQKKTELAKLTAEVEKLSGTTATTTAATATTDEDNVRSAADLAQQRANCEIDTDGDKLTEIQELKCLSKLLASLKGKETASRRKEITRKIEDLYKDLRNDAKSDLFSKDSGRQNNGERLVSDMIAALNGIRFDRDSDRTEMIESLEALRAGAEVHVAASDLEEDVKDLETEMKSSYSELNKLTRDFQNSCRTRTGCDRDIYDQIQDQNSRVSELKEEHYELAETIKEEQEDAIDTLEDYRESMTRTELRVYTSPFAKLRNRMSSMLDARKLNASNETNVESVPGQDSRFDGLPPDFNEVRNGNTALRRGNGMYQVPQNLQVPMGSPQAINGQMMQQPYSPQYMQQGMIPGQGQSLLPAPGGMMNGGMAGNVMPIGQMPMMAGQRQMIPGQQVIPVPGQHQFGAPPIMGGQQIIPPPPRY